MPEVRRGKRENEFIGLDCIAEMGDWVVLRERRAECPPLYWNRVTFAKTWTVPQIIKDAGVAESLERWSVELPPSGLAPAPEAWPEPVGRGRGKGGKGAKEPSTAS